MADSKDIAMGLGALGLLLGGSGMFGNKPEPDIRRPDALDLPGNNIRPDKKSFMDRLREMGESGNPFFNLPSRDVPISGAGGPRMPPDESSMLSNILGGLSGLKSDATLGDLEDPYSIYGGDFNALNFVPRDTRRPDMMGISEQRGPDLRVEDLVMRGDTNEPVTTGGENDFSYVRRGGRRMGREQDQAPQSEYDIVKLIESLMKGN